MTTDPLDRLRERIERAGVTRPPPPAVDESDDPLETLEARLQRASSLSAEAGPLGRLREAVERARRTTSPTPPPDHWASSDEADPLVHLRQAIRTEADWIGSRPPVQLPRAVRSETESTERPAESTGSSLEAVVGREVLRALADEPLAPEDRRRAIERAAALVDDPDETGARELLRLLVGLD